MFVWNKSLDFYWFYLTRNVKVNMTFIGNQKHVNNDIVGDNIDSFLFKRLVSHKVLLYLRSPFFPSERFSRSTRLPVIERWLLSNDLPFILTTFTCKISSLYGKMFVSNEKNVTKIMKIICLVTFVYLK